MTELLRDKAARDAWRACSTVAVAVNSAVVVDGRPRVDGAGVDSMPRLRAMLFWIWL